MTMMLCKNNFFLNTACTCGSNCMPRSHTSNCQNIKITSISDHQMTLFPAPTPALSPSGGSSPARIWPWICPGFHHDPPPLAELEEALPLAASGISYSSNGSSSSSFHDCGRRSSSNRPCSCDFTFTELLGSGSSCIPPQVAIDSLPETIPAAYPPEATLPGRSSGHSFPSSSGSSG